MRKVGLDDGGVFPDFLGRSLGDSLAVIEDEDALADAHDDFHIVLDQEDGERKAVADGKDHLHESVLFGGVHAGGGFIEEEKSRAGGQGAGDFEASLVAVGQRVGAFLHEVPEVQDIEEFEGDFTGEGLLAVKAGRAQDGGRQTLAVVGVLGDHDIIEDGKPVKEADILEGACDAGPGDAVGA